MARVILGMLFFALAVPSLAVVRVALIAGDGDWPAMGAYAGMCATAREWALAGGEVELVCLAGVHAPDSLFAGAAVAMERGAHAVVIWPGGADPAELARLREGLAAAGVLLCVIGPEGEACEAAVRAVALPEALRERPLLCPPPAGEALAAHVGPQPVVVGDAPWLPERLATGAVAAVIAVPAEAWGSHALDQLLRQLDPAHAELMEPVTVPPAHVVYQQVDATGYAAMWAARLAQPAQDYAPQPAFR